MLTHYIPEKNLHLWDEGETLQGFIMLQKILNGNFFSI
jgi:hypothetical protein